MGVAQTMPETVDELLKAYSRQQSFNGVALVARRDSVLLLKGYGLSNVKTGASNTANTIFQVGSLTKQFTAAIILQLQEKNKLSVHDKLSRYLPDYPEGDRITLQNLLTHTAGIYNYTNDEAFMLTSATRSISTDSLIARFKHKPLDFAPGAKFGYSNSGYILLGAVIEKVTGKSWFRVVREDILGPLHMDHSGFDFRGLKSTDKATGYLKLTTRSTVPAMIVDSSVSYSAGSFYTTAGDLYKWDRGLYSRKILSDESLQQAFTPYQAKYAYGWVIDTSYGKRVITHGGSIFGFTAFIARQPADETCIILLDNTGSPALSKIGENINAILNDQPYDFPKPRKEISLDSATLIRYTGEYRLAPQFVITIGYEGGGLVAQATGQGKNELFAEKENFFFLKVVDAQMEFVKGPSGRVDKLILYQGGQQLPGIKIR